MIVRKYRDWVFISLFLVIIYSGFYYSADKIITNGSWHKLITRNLKKGIDDFESEYNDYFSSLKSSLDFFSLAQRILGKHETRSFEVLKSNSGELFLQNSGWPTDLATINEIVNQNIILKNATQKYGGNYLFVQFPYKNAGQAEELCFYSNDQTEQAENLLVTLLSDEDIDVLDLREYSECQNMYKTDHHWTVDSAFNAAGIISTFLKNEYDLRIDNSFFIDKHYYEEINYKKSLLGSIGIKVGPFFAGKDDFSILNPLFETDFDYNYYVNGVLKQQHSGKFWNVFIDESLLNRSDYNNKYMSLMYGAGNEAVILNKESDNELKALLITHSYGRALSPYLSLNFKELRYLDPQKGRYNNSYYQYIEEYQPDYIIMAYNDLVNISN